MTVDSIGHRLKKLTAWCAGAAVSQVRFRLAKPGLMRDFAGEWRVLPFAQATLDAQSSGAQPARGAPWSGLVSSVHSCEAPHTSCFGRLSTVASRALFAHSMQGRICPHSRF